MRDWTLGPGDPLVLTLSADFRLCATDYTNDHIWELETDAGDPPALALRTTYGLRARSMRIFPRFTLGSQSIIDPAAFPLPPRIRRFFPNFLLLDFSPFPEIEGVAEFWVPDSHTCAGRFTITNHSGGSVSLLLELCGQLIPLDGQSLAPFPIQSVNVLAGRSSNLAPIIFLTGGPQPGPGPYPSMALNLVLRPGETRTLTWVQAALSTPKESLELARLTAARPWDSERARIERINAAQTVEVFTGDPDWDAALALSQKTAFSLFLGANRHLPYPSFVITRQPDNGYSPRGDGSDYQSTWNGQPPLEAYYLSGMLPGAPQLGAGLVRNFLSTQVANGTVNWKPGLAGQSGRWLAAPLLAGLAWQTYQLTHDIEFLREVQPGLNAFVNCWFDQQHDRDGDGFPEWNHPLQTGFEDNPAFTVWQAGGQGAEISAAESPALAALLFHEIQSQAHIAEALGHSQERKNFELKQEEMRQLTEACWDSKAFLYHTRDRETHSCPTGKNLGKLRGPGTLKLNQSFRQPIRLLVRMDLKGDITRRLEVILVGQNGNIPLVENLERMDFQWGASLAVATTRSVYTKLDEVKIAGVEKRDQISIRVVDFSAEDVTLFLPLWAEIPDSLRASALIHQTLLADDRFGKPFGIPACASSKYSVSLETDSACQAVHIPWNSLIGEGLLAYGLRAEAAQVTAQLMKAVIQNLKKQHAFARSYHAWTGVGIGDRNPVQGLAPLGLFLQVLGVRIESPRRLVLSGKNPYPWPVTVKYRGLTVTRQAEQTAIVFPDGQTLTLNDPTDAVVSVE